MELHNLFSSRNNIVLFMYQFPDIYTNSILLLSFSIWTYALTLQNFLSVFLYPFYQLFNMYSIKIRCIYNNMRAIRHKTIHSSISNPIHKSFIWNTFNISIRKFFRIAVIYNMTTMSVQAIISLCKTLVYVAIISRQCYSNSCISIFLKNF